MAHKIHKAMYEQDKATKLAGLIELDDSYFGDRNVTGKRGRGASNKKPVFVAVGTKMVKGKIRPSFLKMQISEDVSQQSVDDFIHSCIKPGSNIKTDGFKSFHSIKNRNFHHDIIKILNPKETMEHLPWVHIMIGNVKGILKGVHHGVCSKHLQRFLSEFCYKFNRRFVEKRIFSDLLLACVNTNTITFTELRT